MTITKPESTEYNNNDNLLATVENDILVPAEPVADPNNAQLIPIHDVVPTTEPTTTTDLVVATNVVSKSEDPESTNVSDTESQSEETTPELVPAIPEPNLDKLKRRRVRCQVAAGSIGVATGLVVLGIPGAIILGVAGNKITKHSMKRIENKAKKDYQVRLAEAQAEAEFTPANHNNETLITRAVVA